MAAIQSRKDFLDMQTNWLNDSRVICSRMKVRYSIWVSELPIKFPSVVDGDFNMQKRLVSQLISHKAHTIDYNDDLLRERRNFFVALVPTATDDDAFLGEHFLINYCITLAVLRSVIKIIEYVFC